VSFGQSRVLLVWDRIIFPNGKSIVLEHQPGADTEGYAGLEDGVDYHWGSLLKAAALSTLLGLGRYGNISLSGAGSHHSHVPRPAAFARPSVGRRLFLLPPSGPG